MTNQTNIEWKKKIDEYWNEHDGTNFYKDELIDVISHILEARDREILEGVEGKSKSSDGDGNVQWEVGYEQACRDVKQHILAITKKENEI